MVLDHCTNHLSEIDRYSWDEDGQAPEDANDHTINAAQYGWIPFRDGIGGMK